MRKKIKNVSDIVTWRMCIGCGACLYACNNQNVVLKNFTEHGIRPVVGTVCENCSTCVAVCPGVNNKRPEAESGQYIQELEPYCGPALEVWEGYSSDNFLRENCSSGGIATALALYYLENEQCGGVLHTKGRSDKAWINETVFSTDSASVKRGIGSRYAPASPCDSLGRIAASEKQCVFIGKPCDVSALRNVQAINATIRENVGLAVGIFCAGTPSTKGTFDFLRKNELDPKSVKELHYRGDGWPGSFRAVSVSKGKFEVTYPESWSFLQKYRPFRCYLCADGTSETADISCGDAWYLRGKEEKGISLIIVRNEKGRRILHAAIEKGYVTVRPITTKQVIQSQEQLFARQKEIWGRLITLKIFGIPVPRFTGWHLRRNWLLLQLRVKFKSIGSTLKRILFRKLFRPMIKPSLEDVSEC